MWRSLKLGTIFDIGLYVHWSFPLLLLWVFISNLRTLGAESALYCVTLVVTIFGCVVLHEFGHALTARKFGIPTRDITLYPIGGVARLEQMVERPWEELWITVAGPAVNVVIAAMLLPMAVVFGASLSSLGSLEFVNAGNFLAQVALLNLWLALLNMLPAFPMDGGRVLRALLAAGFGRVQGTEIAAAIGAGMAGIFFLVGVFSGGFMLMLLAIFVLLMGQQELAAVRQRERMRREAALEVLPADPDVLHLGTLPAKPNFSGFTWDSKLGIWVEWRNGRPVHTVAIQPD
jgi:Zn-dependent protease